MDHYLQEAFSHHEIERDEFPSSKCKSVSPAAAVDSFNNSTGCFDCNICLDNANDPVVTLCGHLYCWPCIYKWLHFQSNWAEEEEELQHKSPQCPVCKADVSITTLVPLYGTGRFSPDDKSKSEVSLMDLKIPDRPPACGIHTLLTGSDAYHHLESQFRSHQNQPNYPQNFNSFATMSGAPAAQSPVVNLGGLTRHPMVGMFGEMVHARIFGNSAEVGFYEYPNAYYHLVGSSNPRVRRQEMKAEKSLNRISIFLFCCLILCLLLF